MNILNHFAQIDDPRTLINRKYDLIDILFLTASAVLSGALGWKDIKEFGDEKIDWLRQYRPFDAGIPVDDTIARIVKAIDPMQFNAAFIAWVNEIRTECGQQQIAIDGKTLRHSFDGEKTSALHSITAWSTTQGLVLAQMKSSGKKNENASVLEMLDTLNIKGAHITVDAMNSQKNIIRKIRDKKGDYTVCIKNNHKNLWDEMIAYFHKMDRDAPSLVATYTDIDAGHGRIETRTCRQLRVTEWIEEAREWSGVQSVIEVKRERILSDKKVEQDCQYYISSRTVDVEETSLSIRQHWEVENKAHWVLDVVFKEDDSRIRQGDGAENVAIIRRFCLNLARLHPSKNSMAGKLKAAGWSDTKRSEILFGQ